MKLYFAPTDQICPLVKIVIESTNNFYKERHINKEEMNLVKSFRDLQINIHYRCVSFYQFDGILFNFFEYQNIYSAYSSEIYEN